MGSIRIRCRGRHLDYGRVQMTVKARFYLDLLERAVWTFVQTFAGTYVADELPFLSDGVREALEQMGASGRLSIALGAGAAAVLKALAANKLPWTDNASGSSLPEEVVDPPKKTTKKSGR